MNEVGLPGVAFASWYGIVGQAALPAAIQERLRKESQAVIEIPAVKEKMDGTALQVAPAFGKDFEQIILKEIAGFKALAAAENIVITD
jgi:tripartite-type tricarboxylate transporter receptor subunit TctC